MKASSVVIDLAGETGGNCGRSDDVLLQRVSISFDQLHETAEYAEYARGAKTTAEGLACFCGFIKGARRTKLRQLVL